LTKATKTKKKKGEICEGRQEKNFGGLISTLSIEIVFLDHVKKEKNVSLYIISCNLTTG